MGLLSWVVLGALAGWLGNKIMKKPSPGLVGNIITGVLGAAIGGFLGTRVFHFGTVTGVNLSSILIATLGSVILLWLINAINK